ncbi:double C2-like domain-containing protein beta [Pollicipes pollicipes]|uniref:double C2-like domain-containing protein beta n=1 Tax=Pollicipes pollicipes TaxID=41117 RepID=UPI0018849AA3|nr:double C2-like domain-containing protein beta [Pollicipes pollicipes]
MTSSDSTPVVQERCAWVDDSRLGRRSSAATHGQVPLRTVEFSLVIDSTAESIHCCVHKVKGLRSSVGAETINSYVKLHIVPGLLKTNKLRTKVVSGSGDAEFDETLTYFNVSADVVVNSSLRLSVLDEDPYGHDVLGETQLRLSEVTPHRLLQFCKTLTPVCEGAYDDCAELPQGRILLSLKYVTSRQTLVVGVVRCAELPALDGNGIPDPFVKVQLRPRGAKYKTGIRWKSPSPKFNEEFNFACRRCDLPRRVLDLRVYDKDISKSNDFIGGLSLSIDSCGALLRHWFDALNYVDTRHDRWHRLSSGRPDPETT